MDLLWPIVAIALTNGLIVAIRVFGRYENKAEAVGSDLNLLTFGFAIDLLVQVMHGRHVLPRWPFAATTLLVVIMLLVLNLVLYMLNLSIGRLIAAAQRDWRMYLLKWVALCVGTLSAVMFIVAQAFWG